MIYKSPEERRIRELTEWEERASIEIPPKLEFLREGARSSLFKIPISHQINIKYHETCMHALVAKLQDLPEGLLVYVESGSHHGMLQLYGIQKELTTTKAEPIKVNGSYDRVREINAIYLPRDAILSASYQGTFGDLIENPNISLRLPKDKDLAEIVREDVERLKIVR